MKRIAALLAIALVIPACMHKSQMDERWDGIDGKQVILMEGYEKIVHSNPECPSLKSARGTAVPCKVKDGRLIDEAGNYKNGPETRFALCTCVR
ncbi:MAG: hypothetical protein HY293_12830 [Planctomycetes bacterium]|nr:hypothetical protein [Planctomycetota bacterium]